MKSENHADEKKKKYEKPAVTRFPLRPEEAVLGFCKSNASAGPSGGGCRGVSNCFAPGS
ncbi:MAG TPA: hypothetical protein VF911_18895 [Thermoanaerobaculia bacterium]|jgi:hypothetical protein